MHTIAGRFTFNNLFLICLTSLLYGQVSIHDIQYDEAGSGTYPSPYSGQTVTVGGIVSTTSYWRGGFFITSSGGGAWSGLWILNNARQPSIGDSLVMQGLVNEYLGVTQLTNLTSYQRYTVNNPLPAPVPVSATEASSGEAYEGVVVELRDVTTIQSSSPMWKWQVEDTSGICIIGAGFFSLSETDFPLLIGYPYSSIKGVACGTGYDFQVHPRGLDDLQSAPDAYVVLLDEINVYDRSDTAFPVRLALLNQTGQVSSFEIGIQYNPEIVQFSGVDQTGTLSETGTVTVQSDYGHVSCTFSGDFSFTGIQELLKLNFIAVQNGSSGMEFTTTNINGSAITHRTSGRINTNIGARDIGDILTVIQRSSVAECPLEYHFRAVR
jgi:hypothetical protein